MRDVLMISITPVALILGALAGAWRNRLHPGRDLGLQRPTLRHAVTFTAIFVGLIAVHEGLYQLGGMGEAGSPWRKYPLGALALRVLFVGLVYPFAEELFFRGFILGLAARRAGAVAGIAVSALLFTALHGMAAGAWLGPLLLFVDGAYFGYVRLRSGSLLLPIAFHVLGNSLAIVQRLY